VNQRTITHRQYLDVIEDRVLVFDGAMGTNLQTLGLTANDFGGVHLEGCNDHLVISKPEAVERVHRSFLDVGVDVIETNTFRANRITLGEYGLGEQVFDINHTAARLARNLADEYSTSEQPRFVAGSVGPTGKLISADDPDLSDISFEALIDIYAEQAHGLIEGGVDLLLIETAQDILEVKAAIQGFLKAFEQTGKSIPIQAQVTLDTSGRMLLGTDVNAALTILERLPIDLIGLNCSTGPEHMRDPIRFLGANAALPVSCIPNAGLPLNVDGQAVYPLEPKPFAQDMLEFIEEHNISVVGGCCGTTPEHLKRLVDAVGRRKGPARPKQQPPHLSSAVRAISMQQEPRPLLIGERINTQGSRRAKRLLLAEDYDAITELARDQINGGAHVLDVCVALTERSDEAAMMREVVRRLAMSVEAPLVIDTTEPEVMEAALTANPGRSLLNSVNLEAGRQKLDRVMTLAHQHGAAVIALTIDEEGMAKTSQRKLEIARRIYSIAIEQYGLQPEDLVFDALTFTLATGDPEYERSAMETIEAIRQIKAELPGTLTSLGVSNVSFGLSPQARPVVNSIMLYHCVEAGLDMAIVNPAHIKPYAEIEAQECQLVEDLIFNRHPDALQKLIEYFEAITIEAPEASVDPTTEMSPDMRLHWRILHRHKEGVEQDIDALISMAEEGEQSRRAIEVLNTVLLPAMKEVGDKFGAGELILPFVLQSAEVMKKAVSHLEGYLDLQQGVSKGKIVLATVYGDVHDIGKNLVKTILSNNGYDVRDLGKQVSANLIIDTAIEWGADAIGLSALLVSTSKQMPLIVNELHRRQEQIPVLIGGAAINRRFGRRILFPEAKIPYAGGVFYCKDAFEGLEVMDQLQDDARRDKLMQVHLDQARRELAIERDERKSSTITPRLESAEHIPQAPAWGARVVENMPLEAVFQHLAKDELFRLSWGAKNTHGEAWAQLQRDYEERLAAMKREALEQGWLKPQGVYGYWPAASQGNDLILFDPVTIEKDLQELLRFTFPRQTRGEGLCLADYFRPLDSGEMDLVALQVVTVGGEATRRFDDLQADDDYSESYFTHGLAVQTAEATAEYLHRHIRRELNIEPDQGKRYSWGYPAIPELEDHTKVFQLLPAEAALGMSLSPAFQLIPEQSTAAIILHHPKAKYFGVGFNRVEQLLQE
jgi:5-methyltetrahydrofolate--homocysteine methyltransferase